MKTFSLTRAETAGLEKKGTLMPTVSVVICAYTQERWEETLKAVASVRSQQPAPHQIILVVDHNPKLQTRLAERLSDDVRVVPNNNERGLSGAKNTGVALATGDIVAFLDETRSRTLAGLPD